MGKRRLFFLNNIFGLPILLGLALAFVMPHFALQINVFALPILFLMMFLASLSFDFSILKMNRRDLSDHAISLFIGFLLWPAILLFIATNVIRDSQLITGLFWSSLAPPAIVAPYFVRIHQGDDRFCFQNLILGMFIFPPAAMLMNFLFMKSAIEVGYAPATIDLILITVAPVILAALAKKIKGAQNFLGNKEVNSVFGFVNMTLIGVLSYTYLATALLKTEVNTISTPDIIFLMVLAFAQDFLFYFLSPPVLNRMFGDKRSRALRILISMKNVAISGSVLLFYLPKAALSVSAVFLAHTLLFNYLAMTGPKNENI